MYEVVIERHSEEFQVIAAFCKVADSDNNCVLNQKSSWTSCIIKTIVIRKILLYHSYYRATYVKSSTPGIKISNTLSQLKTAKEITQRTKTNFTTGHTSTPPEGIYTTPSAEPNSYPSNSYPLIFDYNLCSFTTA